MLDSFTSHGGAAPVGMDVVVAGTKLLTVTELHKTVIITNSSDVDIFLALCTGETCTAIANKGVYLAAKTGSFVLTNINAYIGDIWAITSTGTGHVCIQEGR